MKKIIIVLTFLINSYLFIFSDISSSFFLQNRTGVLIKVDVASGAKVNNPKKKGPTYEDIPRQIDKKTFDDQYLSTVTDQDDKNFILNCYDFNAENNTYVLKSDFIPEKISKKVLKEVVFGNLAGEPKVIFNQFYKLDNKSGNYILKKSLDLKDKELVAKNVLIVVLRSIFLYYNKDNEMPVELDIYGSPSPHKFPRISEAKSKALFDIHFVWGGKWVDPTDPNKNVSLMFGINLTNFVMPSLEVSVKYNFHIPSYPFSPYIGGALYGGFWDGFPIGISLMGGSDVYPTFLLDNKTNFYILGETRIGVILLTGIYFDTGYNNEGIYKKFKVLAEGGFYAGVGYRFDEVITRF
ncbi:MAG TPA: hypothetical protein PK771_07795 [Spirochaetota bacterium]|mgnify:CR=1 FL=1|nr:hypothetical protein [Spirochaetota bacterium]